MTAVDAFVEDDELELIIVAVGGIKCARWYFKNMDETITHVLV